MDLLSESVPSCDPLNDVFVVFDKEIKIHYTITNFP